MTSSNGHIFCVTGHLCGEFTVPGEFPAQRPVTRSFDVSFICWINSWVNNRKAGDLRRYRAHYDVIVNVVMWEWGKLLLMQICVIELRQPRMPWRHCLPPGSLNVLCILGHFHRAISHLKWYKIVCMRYLACTFSQMKPINIFSMVLQSGVLSHFLLRFIAVWIYNLTVFMFMYINLDLKL